MNSPKENIEEALKYLNWSSDYETSVQEISDETGLSVVQILNSNDILNLLKENDKLKDKKRGFIKEIRKIDRQIKGLK